jgi:DNA-binding NarL/FixJ family response regulator
MQKQYLEPPPPTVLRTCCRCGRNFEVVKRGARDGKTVCDGCRAPRKRRRSVYPETATLTTREKQVAALVSSALLNKEIAWKLHLTEGTVKEYLFRIFHKLKVPNRTALAIWAVSNGLKEEAIIKRI